MSNNNTISISIIDNVRYPTPLCQYTPLRYCVIASPKKSVWHRSQQVSISKSSLHRILTKYLLMDAYKISLTQELKLNDHFQRKNVSDVQRVDEELKEA